MVTIAALEGVILKAGATSFLLTIIAPGSEHHGMAVARMWEGIMDIRSAPHTDHLRYFLFLTMLVSALV